jgi:hypothetical protein
MRSERRYGVQSQAAWLLFSISPQAHLQTAPGLQMKHSGIVRSLQRLPEGLPAISLNFTSAGKIN